MIPGSCRPLTEVYDTGLFDLDGVVYLGPTVVPAAVAALGRARAQGMRIAFVTNNAARTPAAVAERLTGLGVPATAADVVTSAQACARLVAEQVPSGSTVLVCGGVGLRQALRLHGLRPVSTVEERPAAVVQGFVPGIAHGVLAEGALAVRRGALFVAANADTTLPTVRGAVPGNGSLVQVIATATGQRPQLAGKPERPLHREAMLRTDARRPLVVGDRLDTDIEGAVRAGVDSLLVFTGVTRPVDVVRAVPQHRPTHLAADLTGLHAAHPAADGAHGVGTCDGWRARCGADGFELTGDGAHLDALRALCAAAWTAEEPVDSGAAADVVAKLDV